MLTDHRNMSAEEGPTVKTDAKLLRKFMNTRMIALCFLHLFVCTLACVSAPVCLYVGLCVRTYPMHNNCIMYTVAMRVLLDGCFAI